LKSSAVDRLAEIDDILQKDAFFDESATLGAASTELDKLVASTVESLTKQQDELAETELARWQTLLDWQDLLPDDKNWINSEVEKLAMQTSQDLSGLNRLLAHDYDLNFRLRELEKQVATRADQSRKAREQVPPGVTGGPAEERLEPADLTIAVPPVLESVEQLEGLIKQLQQLRARLIARQPVRITWKQID
jgi:hypothetical protein